VRFSGLPYSLPSGDNVCNFNVATSRRFTTRDGDRRDETTWFRVAVWGRQAESCAKYLAKGRKVLVVGRVSANAFTGRDGEVKASLEINATTVQFLSGRDEDDGMSGSGGGFSSSSSQAYASRDGGSHIEAGEAISGEDSHRAGGTNFDADDEGDIPF
jgi:single-strand DNA-binding protein